MAMRKSDLKFYRARAARRHAGMKAEPTCRRAPVARVILSRWAGKCADCGEAFAAGDPISYLQGERPTHPQCKEQVERAEIAAKKIGRLAAAVAAFAKGLATVQASANAEIAKRALSFERALATARARLEAAEQGLELDATPF
jgi:hypothetical protein